MDYNKININKNIDDKNYPLKEFFNTFFDRLPFIALFVTKTGMILALNDKAQKIIEIHHPDFTNKSIDNLLHFLDSQGNKYSFETIASVRDPIRGFLADINGKILFPFELVSIGINWYNYKGYLLVIYNLNRHLKVELELRQEKEKYKMLVNTMTEGIIVIDDQQRITYVNKQILDWLGYSDSELQNVKLENYITIDTLSEILNNLATSFKTGLLTKQVEGMIKTKNNDKIPILAKISPLFDSDHILHGYLFIITDLSELKKKEKELKQLNENLEQLVKERTNQLQHALNELEAFSYSVSHDLRSPLRRIYAFAEALLEDYNDILDGEFQEYVTRIMTVAKQMDRLINDLLTLSKITRREIIRKKIDLSVLVKNIINDIRQNYPPREKISFIIENNIQALVDISLVRIALMNLLDNAFKFTSKNEETIIEFGMEKRKDN